MVYSNKRQCQGSLGDYNSHGEDVQLKANKYLVLRPEVISTVGFPSGSLVKNLPARVGDAGSVLGSGRSSGRGTGNPLQCSCLGNPKDRGSRGLQPMELQS